MEHELRQQGGAMKEHTAFSLGQNAPLAPSPWRGLRKPGKAGRKQGCLSRRRGKVDLILLLWRRGEVAFRPSGLRASAGGLGLAPGPGSDGDSKGALRSPLKLHSPVLQDRKAGSK